MHYAVGSLLDDVTGSFSRVWVNPEWHRKVHVRVALTARRLYRRRANRARKRRAAWAEARKRARIEPMLTVNSNLSPEAWAEFQSHITGLLEHAPPGEIVRLDPAAVDFGPSELEAALPAIRHVVGVDLGCQRSHSVTVVVDDEGNLVSFEEA